ncbi:3D domain-containing protein [Niallia taxi]|uniref:Radical SAM protein n=1 Tax=Niallia taxi TaxID=2499688 RepID=A0A3S3SI57_9BACI|nr:3D domain-containing protein [Niallia taxi]MCM3217445.1 3D domain-containing protein [Niallia taxi]MDK8641360.1 3D domain-containing protein [Niallia taxi]MED4039502.1 3D domain-containing protein [Niallia taxi]MED4055684.1 3D domain-containing protein [Niallia taxi]MED4121346.1 3D domain-containing protein [Niallia taxi]
MSLIKKMMVLSLICASFFSTSLMAHAETSQETLTNGKSKLEENDRLLDEKEQEQQQASKELKAVQDELESTEGQLEASKKEISSIEGKIEETKLLIEEKKDQIVELEDKVLERKDVMKDRLVALQNTDKTNIIMEVILNAQDLSDFIDRAAAVSAFYNGDKDLLEQQQQDLETIEAEKKDVDDKEAELQQSYESLAENQSALEANLDKRQAAVSEANNKYKSISKEIKIAESEKAAIQAELKDAEESIKKQQEEAAARKKVIVQQQTAVSAETTEAPKSSSSSSSKGKSNSSSNSNKNSSSKKESSSSETIYVSATAYSHESTKSDYTALGYNIKKNANMKLIAVDPSVIPLGSKVWVEGYGEAIAGDTGGAIKGHKIDVLMPNNGKAKAWGRKTVKVKILD